MTTSQQQFYEKIGFQKNSTTTMVLYSDQLSVISDQNFLIQQIADE
jgi:predicted lactoylglutathione lyase